MQLPGFGFPWGALTRFQLVTKVLRTQFLPHWPKPTWESLQFVLGKNLGLVKHWIRYGTLESSSITARMISDACKHLHCRPEPWREKTVGIQSQLTLVLAQF